MRRGSSELDALATVEEDLARGVSDPPPCWWPPREPTRADLQVFHRSPTMRIFAAILTPRMDLMLHDHLMGSLTGLTTGREDNIVWRRTAGRLEAYLQRGRPGFEVVE